MTDGTNQRVRVIDSHTGGEPTRVVVSGGPDLGNGPLAERLERFRSRHDDFRSAVVNEPRGSGVMVGALLCEPVDRFCVAGVIFFNNVGYLGMCGHGTIGLMATLSFLNKVVPGEHRIETPVGTVSAILHASGEVTVNNVASYRLAANVEVNVPGHGKVRGDVAWGGNWFFLVREHEMDLSLKNVAELTNFTWAIRQALRPQGITGANNQEIDHVELFGPSGVPAVNGKTFTRMESSAKARCGSRRALWAAFSKAASPFAMEKFIPASRVLPL